MLSDYLLENILFYQFVNNLRNYYYEKNVFDIDHMGDGFQIFIISRKY